MRCLNRNKIPFFYAPYLRKEPIIDEYGNDTGQYEVIYGNPSQIKANISAAKGETSVRQFGEDVTYDKIIVIEKPFPQIDEHAVLWIDTIPQVSEDGSLVRNDKDEIITPWDYIVVKVAQTLNSVSIAVRKVLVSG